MFLNGLFYNYAKFSQNVKYVNEISLFNLKYTHYM